jgi:conjugal transfer mating pair stabilization protein TraN
VTPEPANEDFGASATWLNVLDEMAKDAEKSFDAQELTIFDGTDNSCRVGKLGVLNCCNDTGWGNGLLGSCTEAEYALMDRMVAGATHYIGSYCSKRFFVCLQTRRVYCQFNSKLARVFVEGLRNQTGETWGTPRPSYRYVETCPDGGDRCTYTPVPIEGTGPNCEGVTVEEMETVNLEDIDLSEAFADFVAGTTVPSISLVQNFLKSRVGSN